MTPPKSSSLAKAAPTQRRLENEEEVRTGEWYWIESDEGPWLGCVTHIGSNYFELSTAAKYGTSSVRIPQDQFDCKKEPDPEAHIKAQIAKHRANIESLLGEAKQLCSKLGLSQLGPVEAAGEALVQVQGNQNVKRYSKALVRAKEKTLPELFGKIEEENEQIAKWMKATLLPLETQVSELKAQTKTIADRIFAVELYAGLIEELVQLTDGEAAPDEIKIHLFQRRHYMDEECLARYEAGGMELKDIDAFDAWLMRPENRERILPFPRSVVAFRVRRHDKEREVNFFNFIDVMHAEAADKKTFLYFRNGERTYRLTTGIDFGEQLFPDKEKTTLLADGKKLYAKTFTNDIREVLTEGEYLAIKAEHEKEKAEYKAELAAWKKLSKKEQEEEGPKPWYHDSFSFHKYERIDRDNVFYDDVMALIADDARAHNRIVLILQGILDRSPAFHPHPPWRLWTATDFQNALELVYDDSRALTAGKMPDFEAYRKRLNASIKRGTHTVGQQAAWNQHENERNNTYDQYGRRIRRYYYRNPGPGRVARVVKASRDGKCSFAWQRGRQTTKWVPNPDRPGYLKPEDSTITAHFTCSRDELLNVDAYTPGDYRIFFADPRTRAQYLQWAPLLLAAEDFKAGKMERHEEE